MLKFVRTHPRTMLALAFMLLGAASLFCIWHLKACTSHFVYCPPPANCIYSDPDSATCHPAAWTFWTLLAPVLAAIALLLSFLKPFRKTK